MLFVGGFALLAVARRLGDDDRRWPVVGSVSRATETACGIALVIAGYHVVAYSAPPGWVTFRVPVRLAWLVFVACAVAVVATVATDRLLRDPSDPES